MRRAQPWLGTLVHISVTAIDPAPPPVPRSAYAVGIGQAAPTAARTDDIDVAIAAAFTEIGTVHRLMSPLLVDSDLARLNAAPLGTPVTIDARTAEVLGAAAAWWRHSNGAFDCTLDGNCGEASDGKFGGECEADDTFDGDDTDDDTDDTADANGDTADTDDANDANDANDDPADDALDRTVGQMVDPGAGTVPVRVRDGPGWQLDGLSCWRTDALCIDLGGIAKGYAVDRAIAVLAASGVREALVDAGGDLRHLGASPVRIALRDPADPGRCAAVASLCNGAIASSAVSGLDGPAIAHTSGAPQRLIDRRERPSTSAGRRRGLAPGAGASVAATSCMDADAATKVVLVTGDTRHPALLAHRARVLLYRPAAADRHVGSTSITAPITADADASPTPTHRRCRCR